MPSCRSVSESEPGEPSLARIQERLLKAQNELRKEHNALRCAQAQLRESRRRYADLFEFAPVGYVTLDREGLIQEINAAAASLLSAPVRDLRGGSFAAQVAPAETAKFLEYFQTCWSSPERLELEISIQRSDGSAFPAQLITIPAHVDGKGHVELRMSMVDLTELKRTQLALQRVNEELERRVEERTAELRRANQELSEEVARRNRLEAELLEISEREKRRFGQDLHDETCQSLAGLSLLATVIARELKDASPAVLQKIERLSYDLRGLVEQTRNIARGLHPVTLSGGLVLALRELVDRVQERVPCTLAVLNEPTLTHEQELALYRIAQEASHNAIRHARASQISISLCCLGSHHQLTVEDDGRGLPEKTVSAAGTGMGLDIMGYRARSIGAVLTVENRQEGGVRVSCLLPAPEGGVCNQAGEPATNE